MMELRAYLKQGGPLLFDGAMGTCFAALPDRAEERCEQANLDRPEDISAIHRAYLEAGCRAIKTNSFSVGVEMARGEEYLAGQMIEAGCRLALEAARPYDAYVFADIGPAPREKEMGPGENYRRQIDIFLEHGLTNFLLETLPSDDGVAEAGRYLKERCPEAYLIVSFAVGYDGVTREGRLGAELLRRTASLPEVDGAGFNCVSGPHHLLEYIRGLDLSGVTLSVMPNAGYPTVLGRRVVFQGTTDYFGKKMGQIVQAGASIIGGCCGTTPEHIAKTAEVLKAQPKAVGAVRLRESAVREVSPQINALADKLDSGQRVIAVELDPPADDDLDFFLEGVQALRTAGADEIGRAHV